MLSTIFPALDIAWNPSSAEDMRYFSEFMVEALEAFQGMVNRDFASSIEPYVFMFNLSTLRDSLGLNVVSDDRLAHHFCPTTVFFMRSILPSHRAYTITEAQDIIRENLLQTSDLDGLFKIYSIEEAVSAEKICLLSHRAGAHKLSNSIIAQLFARGKNSNKNFPQKFKNYVLNEQLTELLNDINFWGEEEEVKSEVIF